MKRLLIALTLISCGVAAGSQEPPKSIRVCVQFIEVQHSSLTEILAGHEKSGQALHQKAVALSKHGQAKILETCMVICRSGQKASLESIREEIYPTEYPTSRMTWSVGPTPEQLAAVAPVNPVFRAPTAFETRNTGVTLDIAATSGSDDAVELELSPEIVTPLRLETWMEHVDPWGDGSIRMPIYESWRVKSSIRVESGKFELVSALTPKANAPVPAVSRKILVFVRADILPPP